MAVFISKNGDRLARVMIAVMKEKGDFPADFFLETPGRENLSDQITLGEKSARLLAETNDRMIHRLRTSFTP